MLQPPSDPHPLLSDGPLGRLPSPPQIAPTMYALTHCTLYTGHQQLTEHALLIEGNAIRDIVPQAHLPAHLPTLNGQGWAAAPGFIDLQLNGCGGVMFNDTITAATLDAMHRTNLRSGTTSFLPTLITCPDGDMHAAIDLMRTYGQCYPHRVLGLHLEGPYLNPTRSGIHNRSQVRPIDAAMVKAMVKAGPAVVRLLTLAPEQVPATTIAQLAAAGIVVSAGHTNATYEQALAGFEAGVSMVTHLFNAMTPWQGRKPGMVGATFHHPEVYAGIIADGHHVHWGSVGLAQQIKGDRLILVSDGTPAAGADLESFVIGGHRVFYQDGKCVSAEGTLGGSALTLITAVANCVRHLDLPLAEALRMASLYPACALGLTDRLGELAPGRAANVVLFDPDHMEVKAVIDGGQPVAIAEGVSFGAPLA